VLMKVAWQSASRRTFRRLRSTRLSCTTARWADHDRHPRYDRL